MAESNRSLKRPRTAAPFDAARSSEAQLMDQDLPSLLMARDWDGALERVRSHRDEAESLKDPSPLALSCRLGAPFPCFKAVLDACPGKVRHLLDSRGTPLHEAVVCEETGPEVIRELLRVDEALGDGTPRATILQDVDGYTPLHLLIRRRFQSHVLLSASEQQERSHLMELLEMLVRSCAEALVISDRGEYEEPPIVMALKANVYAPLIPTEDENIAWIEFNIHEMVRCMLSQYPLAASCVFKGYRGKYTALHSAVFHGRCPDTLELLLKAESQSHSAQKACLLGNTQGELPLHFCAMRGEPPRSVALLAEAAPEAVSQRDASGLTPFHWLWARFISSMLVIEEGGRDALSSISQQPVAERPGLSRYLSFAALEQGDFEADLHLIRRLDPSVDFLRMRHIPVEAVDESEALQWIERTTELLAGVRARHESPTSCDCGDRVTWSRVEAVACLFWTKVVSLLRAMFVSDPRNESDFSLVLAAFQSQGCPPPVARIIATLYPEEMEIADGKGRLALHHASMKEWHSWDWSRGDGSNAATNSQLLQLESASTLRTALSFSSPLSAKTKDSSGSLPLHYAIVTFVKAFRESGRSCHETPMTEVLGLLQTFIQMNPDSLQEQDPVTKLFPYLQATAVASELQHAICTECHSANCTACAFPEEFSISITYELLRKDPSLLMPRSS